MIPVDWKFEDLSFCLERLIDYRGKSIPKSESGVSLITARNVKSGFLDFSEQEYISMQDYTSRMTRGLPQEGDLLFTTEAPLGNTALFPLEGKNYAVGQRLVTLRPNKNVVEARYLMYYFLSDFGKREIKIRATGSTAIGIRQSEFTKIRVLLPPLLEQRKIIDILATWDRAIDLIKQLIVAKQKRKHGLEQQLLMGKKRFRNFANLPWSSLKAGDIFQPYSKRNNGNEELLSVTQEQGVIPRSMLATRVVMPAGETASYKFVESGDFIISLRSFQGGIEYSSYQGLVSPAYTILKPKQPIIDSFYKHLFKSQNFISHLSVAIIGIRDGKQINFEDFATIRLAYPMIEEQKRIAEILDMCDDELALLNSKLILLKKQKQGLMQQLLTGKVRVKT